MIEIGTFVGELGWEVMMWRPYLLAKYTTGEGLLVRSRPGREPLYDWLLKSGATFEDAPLGMNASMYSYLGPPRVRGARTAWERIQGVPVVKGAPVRYEPLGDHGHGPHVLLHARGRSIQAHRNWPDEHWEALARSRGDMTAAVGHPEGARAINGASDLRGWRLSVLINAIHYAKVIVGPSSGPMHVATMCGCPQVVWSDNPVDQVRHETLWNPLGTPVRFLGTACPSVDQVARAVEELL